MSRLALFLAGFLIAGMPHDAIAQDYGATRAENALRDAARAQERQAEVLRHIEIVQRDAARAADRDRRNAERDSRSMRWFDR